MIRVESFVYTLYSVNINICHLHVKLCSPMFHFHLGIIPPSQVETCFIIMCERMRNVKISNTYTRMYGMMST